MRNSTNAEELDKSRKRKHLSADEKAKQNRDRNREHAKNTRLRKKAYVSKLKNLVDQLSHIKEVEGRERKMLGERIYSSQEVRKNAVKMLLQYRAMNVRDIGKWASIVDEGVVVTLPITPFRWFHKTDIVNSARVLVGIDALLRDNASQAFMAKEIGQGAHVWKGCLGYMGEGSHGLLSYTIRDEDMIAAGELVMCCYVLALDGSISTGKHTRCSQSGMLQCKFNKQNKIVALELIYDVMGFMQQLQRTELISPENSIVPNTLSMALQPSSEPRIIVRTEPPFPVVHLNEAWSRIKGTQQRPNEVIFLVDALGATSSTDNPLRIFQMLFNEACTGRPVSTVIQVSTTSMQGGRIESGDSGDPHRGSEPLVSSPSFSLNYVKILPLSDRGNQISHALVSVLVISSEEAEMFLRNRSPFALGVNAPPPVPVAMMAGGHPVPTKQTYGFSSSDGLP